jgi:hypothetical protein
MSRDRRLEVWRDVASADYLEELIVFRRSGKVSKINVIIRLAALLSRVKLAIDWAPGKLTLTSQ